MADESPGKRITIIGTGLIGGSIGLALKAAGLKGVEIVGHDRERGNANQAQKMGAVDRAVHRLPEAVAGAALVIIATPILAVRETMAQIAPDLSPGAVVTDTASTKAQVMSWARELLPEDVNFIGGHPLAGKETMGIENADAGLFRGKPYCICPSVDASEESVKSLLGLARLLGAEPMFIDPEEHDQYAAAISHLPLMVAAALFTLMRSSPAWPDMGAMASSGFRDMTRLASGDALMAHGMVQTNREAIIHWLDRMSEELVRLRSLLQDAQDEALLELLARTQVQRDDFLANPPRRQVEAATPSAESAKKTALDLLVGGMLADRFRKAQQIPAMMRDKARPAATGDKKLSLSEKMAEDIRRDLEKLEDKRAAKKKPGEEPE